MALSIYVTSGAAPAVASQPPIPQLSEFNRLAIKFGEYQAAKFRANSGYGHYYDAAENYYNIHDHFGNPAYDGGVNPGVLAASTPWATDAGTAADKYRTESGITNVSGGGAAGTNKFTRGLRLHWERASVQASKDAVLTAATTGAASDATDPGYYRWWHVRETAYAIEAHIDAEALGATPRPRLQTMVDGFLNYMIPNILKVPFPTVDYYGDTVGVIPFWWGLGARALIRYYERYPDAAVPTGVKTIIDFLYTNLWRPNAGGFVYNSAWGVNDNTAEPGLNSLIAPAYAWYYQHSGTATYQTRGDEIFQQWVTRTQRSSELGDQTVLTGKGSYLWDAKQFNQGWRWMAQYVAWRS